MTKDAALSFLAGLVPFLMGLIPGAFGAALAVVYQGIKPWPQRILYCFVGVVVAHYIGALVDAIWNPDGRILDTVKVVAGITAFEGMKQLRAGIVQVAGSAPKDLWDNLKSWFGRKPV